MRSLQERPTFRRASKARPAVSAPSPTTATTLPDLPRYRRALRIPLAAESAVEE